MFQLLRFRQLTLTFTPNTLNNLSRSWLIKHQPVQQKYIHNCRTLQQRDTDHKKSATNTLQERKQGDYEQAVSTDVRPLGEKIKDTTVTASYTAIIIAGIGVTGLLFWAIFRELFSSKSPNNIYSQALDIVKSDVRVQDALGAPIKGYGEESRRGRRQHVAFQNYERNGVPHMRMKFYVQGIRNKATVELETREVNGKVEYRYLFLQLDYYPHTTIIIEDNRAFDQQPNNSAAGINNNTLALTGFTKE